MNEIKMRLLVAVMLLTAALMLPLLVARADDTQAAKVEAGAGAGNPLDTPVSVTTTTTTTTASSDVVAVPPVEDTLASAFKGARDGNWRLLAAGVLSLIMTLAYKLNVRQLPIFNGDRGGAILVMVLSLMGAVATALASNQPINPQLFLGAVGVAFTAVGGWTWIKRVAKPADGNKPVPAQTPPIV